MDTDRYTPWGFKGHGIKVHKIKNAPLFILALQASEQKTKGWGKPPLPLKAYAKIWQMSNLFTFPLAKVDQGNPKVHEEEKAGKNKDTNGGEGMNSCKKKIIIIIIHSTKY